jgi:hypothetical protein
VVLAVAMAGTCGVSVLQQSHCSRGQTNKNNKTVRRCLSVFVTWCTTPLTASQNLQGASVITCIRFCSETSSKQLPVVPRKRTIPALRSSVCHEGRTRAHTCSTHQIRTHCVFTQSKKGLSGLGNAKSAYQPPASWAARLATCRWVLLPVLLLLLLLLLAPACAAV